MPKHSGPTEADWGRWFASDEYKAQITEDDMKGEMYRVVQTKCEMCGHIRGRVVIAFRGLVACGTKRHASKMVICDLCLKAAVKMTEKDTGA